MKGFFFALSVACGIVRAAADPLADFEITPDPGMPSLESVGLSKESCTRCRSRRLPTPGHTSKLAPSLGSNARRY
ncbi:predicted protein [Chaetomium globosum CBS 148.51]|uniref:Uncharacterized protein n=1 Tax=Chaetomium globosum (strain ATCC 6205 / CBS 148.51 / DSM 1962 / NBRC 6347 / NRRL 1970) TaxID=306901 RepID=Q2HAT9_CHAGB|nr:uncharacterized protein CHGG_02665 [Chaetomium globosum CBS 148.51]EAQ90730.1 predicted protein [Chaetomium globosum CBS 148.51]